MKQASDFKPGDRVRMVVVKHYNHSRLRPNLKPKVLRVTGGGRVVLQLGNGKQVAAYPNDLELA